MEKYLLRHQNPSHPLLESFTTGELCRHSFLSLSNYESCIFSGLLADPRRPTGVVLFRDSDRGLSKISVTSAALKLQKQANGKPLERLVFFPVKDTYLTLLKIY